MGKLASCLDLLWASSHVLYPGLVFALVLAFMSAVASPCLTNCICLCFRPVGRFLIFSTSTSSTSDITHAGLCRVVSPSISFLSGTPSHLLRNPLTSLSMASTFDWDLLSLNLHIDLHIHALLPHYEKLGGGGGWTSCVPRKRCRPILIQSTLPVYRPLLLR